LGGHIVQGHVDGVGTITAVKPEGDGVWMEIAPPAALQPYIAEKGSVAVDGISLTVADVLDGGHFAVALIPHTLAVTTLGRRCTGDRVNLEVDILAKYVERLLEGVRGR
jgi:riboflavin synthase alpha subunit